MIIENKTTENGDVLYISTSVPVLGLVLLYGFIDNTSGETSDMYYQKKFRYSKDIGTTWSPWVELNSSNLQNVPIQNKESFLFEYTYEHEGRNGEMFFNWVQLEGEMSQGNDTIYQKTDFKQFFDVNDINVLGWAFNVLEKLYEQGILPKYIQRDYTESSQDFIAYWLSITHFFALIVYMARQFMNIKGNNILFNLFLEGRGLILTGDETQLQKDYLFANYINEYRKRGTRGIIGTDNTVNGEFLRLINYNPDDEFMFFNLVRQDLGWCMDYSSPMWTGTEQIMNATKGYEYSDNSDSLDISKYPIVGNATVFQQGEYDWIRFGASAGENGINVATPTKENLFKIAPSIPYEIFFVVMATAGSATAPDHLNFGAKGYDENLAPLSFINGQTGADSNSFYSTATPRVINKLNVEYWIRGVIWSADTSASPGKSLNFLNGVPLISNKDMKFFTPVISQQYQSGDKTLMIRDVKVKPLNLSIERGYLSSILPIATYFYNNSGREESYIKDFTERYLLSYKNNILLPTYLAEVDVIYYTLSITWTPLAGGTIVGAGIYRAGELAEMRITPSVGYQISSVVIDGESKVPESMYLIAMTKNITASVVFTQTLMNIITQKRAFSFEGTVYTGDLVVNWGDGSITTNQLTHRYTDSLSQHTITINSGTISVLNIPENEILSIDFTNMESIKELNVQQNLLSQIDISKLTQLTSINASNNQLTTLSFTSNTGLTDVNISSNKFTSVNVSPLNQLMTLNVANNQLTTLNTTTNTKLNRIVANNNQLTTATYPTSVTYLNLNSNKMTSFPLLSGNQISFLDLGNNLMTSLSFAGAGYTKLQTLLLNNMPNMANLTISGIGTLTTVQTKSNPRLSSCQITGNTVLTSLDVSACENLLTLSVTNNARLNSINTTNDSKLSTLTANHNALTSINLATNINLTNIDLSFNTLTAISISNNTLLQVLNVSNNALTALTVNANTRLTSLDCSVNMLTVLNLTGLNSLTYLDCSSNKLTDSSILFISPVIQKAIISNNVFNALVIYNASGTLAYVDCSNNSQLRKLDAGNNKGLATLLVNDCAELTYLGAHDCALTVLNASNDVKLEVLDVFNNQLGSINNTGCGSIREFYAYSNLLTTVNTAISGDNLFILDVSQNQLTRLDLTSNRNVATVDCSNNNLTLLNIGSVGSNMSITTLDCSNNRLNDLDLRGCGSTLTTLDCSYNILGQTAVGTEAIFFDTSTGSNALKDFDASNNQLKSINIAPNINLVTVNISNNANLTSYYTGGGEPKNVLRFYPKEAYQIIDSVKIASTDGYVKVSTRTDAFEKMTTFIAFNTSITVLDFSMTPNIVKIDVHDCTKIQRVTSFPVGASTKVEYLDISNTPVAYDKSDLFRFTMVQVGEKLKYLYAKKSYWSHAWTFSGAILVMAPDLMPNLVELDISEASSEEDIELRFRNNPYLTRVTAQQINPSLTGLSFITGNTPLLNYIDASDQSEFSGGSLPLKVYLRNESSAAKGIVINIKNNAAYATRNNSGFINPYNAILGSLRDMASVTKNGTLYYSSDNSILGNNPLVPSDATQVRAAFTNNGWTLIME